jgi:glucose/arabinose dehydrogenase
MITRQLTIGAAAALALVLGGCGGSEHDLDQEGPQPELPEVSRTLIPTIAIASPGSWNGEQPTVPAGFTITALATDLQIPRQMLVLPNGDILVAEGSGGGATRVRPKDVIAGILKARGKSDVKGGNRITLLRDADGDGVAEVRSVFIDGLNAPYGLALVGSDLYVANQDALLQFTYQPGQTRITSPGRELVKLPSELNHHWTKALTASPDGSMLYVGIGSNSNAGERGMAAEVDRAMVWEIERASGRYRPYATGLRNPTALDFNPATGALWAVVNERDEIGPQLPPDYLTSVREGGFYGWPYSYWGANVDPRPRPQNPALVRSALVPDYALGSHVAALGLSFARGAGLGAGYGEGAFVGMHGSWNRGNLSGYKVVWVPFRGGRPAGDPQDFVTGFLDGNGGARGRPVGVTFDPIGNALLVADDLSNTVWRVAPTTRPATPAVPAASPTPAG